MDDMILVLEQATLLAEAGTPILREVDARLPRGAKAVLDGEPEAGRSCLLRACAGLVAPGGGRILLDGTPFRVPAFLHPLIRRGGLGWVPTSGGLLVNQTLRANVALPLRFTRRLAKAAAEEASDRWLAALGLQDRAHLRPHALDPRDRWLGAMARAAALDPELWLVDRPPGSLDPTEAHRAATVIREASGAVLSVFEGPGPGGCRWVLAEGRLSVEGAHAT